MSVTVYGATHSYGNHIHDFKALDIIYKKATQGIDVTPEETIWWAEHG